MPRRCRPTCRQLGRRRSRRGSRRAGRTSGRWSGRGCGSTQRRLAGHGWRQSGVVRCSGADGGSRQAYRRSNRRRRSAGVALGALIRGGNHGPQPRVESHARPTREASQNHAEPHIFDRPAQVVGQATANARDHAVAAADQRGALYSGCHVPIQTRIRVPRTGNQRCSGVSKGSFRVSPSRGHGPRDGRIEV